MLAIYLVACVGEKLDHPAPARDLYRSDWFRKARAYVESIGAPWYILSAMHGLVEPHRSLAPYDVTLRAFSASERRLWGEYTATQLSRVVVAEPASAIVFLAGRLYREPLLGVAGDRGVVPMAGLGIGQQKAWLTAHTPSRMVSRLHA